MMTITLAYATLQQQVEIPLQVEENCTIALAIARAGILKQFPELSMATLRVGIHGRETTLDAALKADDRVEIYRPLVLDPKERRRRLGRHQGVKQKSA